MASGSGKLETVRTLVELGVEKEAKDEVRNDDDDHDDDNTNDDDNNNNDDDDDEVGI